MGPGQRALRIILLLTSALVLFGGPALRAGWALDDQETIEENPLVAGERPAMHAFGQDYWHHRGDAGLYRPLVTLSLRFNRAWLGNSPGGFHGINLALHLGVVFWAGVVLLLMRPHCRLPWFGWALFALHPVQSEAVVWIAGRSSSLCALVGLIPLAMHLAGQKSQRASGVRSGAWAFVGVLLPLLVKEDGLAFAALWWLLPGAAKRSRRICVLIALVAIAGLRIWALGGLGLDPSHGALGSTPLAERIPLGLGILGKGAACILWPPLALQEVDGSGMGWQVLGALLLLGICVRIGRLYSMGQDQFAWAGALCLSLLPWLQWFPSPELFGPRYLYLPLLFLIPLLPRLPNGRTVSIRLYALQLILLTGLLTPVVHRLSAGFHSPLAYWLQRTEHRSGESRSWSGLAHALLKDGPRTAESNRVIRGHFERAISIDPNYSRPHVGLATLARRMEKPELEQRHLRRAISIAQGNAIAWANMGALQLRQKNCTAAAESYSRATLLQPGRAAFWRGLARSHAGMDQMALAEEAIQEARRLAPSDPLTLKWYERLVR
ncbi:MAG: hypothetical protein GY930_09665 [bacterium]|nr:hypothetical protein [bacterium]